MADKDGDKVNSQLLRRWGLKLTRYTICFSCLVLIGLWFGTPTLEEAISLQQSAQSVPPDLTHVDPNRDMVAGGVIVQIIGENFQAGATVTIGGNAASNVIFDSPSKLIVEVPAGVAGSADVVVTNPDGKSDTLPNGFTYYLPAPTLTRVNPNNDVVTGGATVQIIGKDFQAGATVTIGGNAASNVIFISPTELTVEVPPGVAGSADVVVTNPDGKSDTLPNGFTYYLPAPTLTRVDPNNDVVTGEATVQIIGKDFQAGATVTIGGNRASNVIFVSPIELTVEVPPGTAGNADVVVINPDGKSDTLTGGFTYTEPPPPTLTDIEPDNDVVAGGATIQIIGENFQDGATVTIGGNAISNVIFISPTELTVEVPPGVAGSADVVVINPDGKSDTLAGGFTYIETPQFPRHDVNQDGEVNIFDLVAVASQFNAVGEGLPEDVNGDGTVNIFDLVAIADHFGEGAAQGAPSLTSLLTPAKFAEGWTPRQFALDLQANRRLRAALAELETQADINPDVRFVANLLHRWLIDTGTIPNETRLYPNFPNPFNPETWIPYQLAEAAEVHISIYDAKGQPVRELPIGFRMAGIYTGRSEAAFWNGRNDIGELVTSGIYFYTLRAGDFSDTRKMLILK